MDQLDFQLPSGLRHPPLMNQPPQVFGQYQSDGRPAVPHIPTDLASQMFSDSMLMEDTNEAKRRRIARACDMCRKKKIKCDGKLPACTQCINYKTECTFTQVEKKRQPPKGVKYIEGLEKRLRRMEHLLSLSGLLDEDENGATDLGALERKLLQKQERQEASRTESSHTASNPVSPSYLGSRHDAMSASPTSPKTEASKDRDHKRQKSMSVEVKSEHHEVEQLSEMMCSLVTNQSGETRYIGSSSGFSIFSPQGVQWVNEKTGDDSFQQMISDVSVDDHKWTNWKPEVFNDLFQRPVFRPLPSKEEALSLLTDYFENFNPMLPLFHQPTFMHLVERQYSSDPYQGSGWWASLNCALAIAHRLRVMSNLSPAEDDQKAWGYLKNAMGVFSELTMRNTDLLSVQALLGMALFMQGTPNPQPAFLLIAAAIRLSHSIGLHRRGTGFNLNPIEIEQRKRVFWIAYMLDKDLCLRSGRPPAQDDDDMNVDLPDADPEDNVGMIPLADGKGKMNLFRVMCEFTTIESKVYKRLYSTKATKQTDGELLNAIGELDHELEQWKDSIPIDFRPEHEIKASHTPLMLHVVMLHFTYYNCLTTIHRMSIHHGYWTSRLSNYAIEGLNAKALNPRVFSSAALCTAAARASISLLKYVPQGDFSSVWLILYFPVSALVTLFGNILQNPLDPRAKSDTRLMNLVVNFLSMLGQEAEQGGVHRMLGVCSEFERIAKAVIEKAENGQTGRRKRKTVDVKSQDEEIQVPSTDPPTTRRESWGPLQSTSSKASSQNPNHPASKTNNVNGPSSNLSPRARTDAGSSTYSPTGTSPLPSAGWPPSHEYPFSHQDGEFEFFAGDPNAFSPGTTMQSPQQGMLFPFQQPLLPQDLFSLPMTLDWSWAEMSGQAYPTVENGNFDRYQADQSWTQNGQQ